MKKKIIFITVLIMMVCLTGCNKEEKPIIAKGDFEVQFLKLENEQGNKIYSPLSIKYALSMLNEGADGKTKEEIENLIKDLKLPKYKSIDKNLSFANALYIRDTYKEWVKEEFAKTLKEKYDAEIKFDTFANASNINKFIEEKTLGIIKNMLDNDVISNELAKMVLINALAIDMEWKNSFGFESTYGSNFTLNDGNVVKATTMHKSRVKTDDISFYKNDEITALSMDLKKYDDVELEFMAIMPNGSLNDYIKDFQTEKINEIKSKLILASNTKNGVNISIPKFKFNYDLNLKEDLIALGVKEAFDDELANFTKMTNNPLGLYVSSALHKADIDFSEKGVKAAAVTVFVMYEKNSIEFEKPEEVVIDKPFLFIIRDKTNGEIWFVGTVYSPNLWEKDASEYKTN